MSEERERDKYGKDIGERISAFIERKSARFKRAEQEKEPKK